jgi:hypothetical protein
VDDFITGTSEPTASGARGEVQRGIFALQKGHWRPL